jgi:NADPH:quinone reductase-like Zn-dependent oxidoreductase
MKALAIDNWGGRDQIKIMDLRKPSPGQGEILVRVKAAGVNPADAKIREGLWKTRMPHQFPIILGLEMSGVVEANGPGAGLFCAGEAVFAFCRKPVIQHGTDAEHVCIPETFAAAKPARASFEEAAGVPLAALTAWQSLFDAAGLKRGMKVLIHAGAGGVGGFGIQLAKQAGAYVISTAGARNHDYVRGLGADEAIDYRAVDFREAVRSNHRGGVDIAFDTVGGDVQTRSADVVRQGGVLVSILAFKDENALQAKGIQTAYVFAVPNARQLADLARRIDEGTFSTCLSTVLPLEEGATAHEMIETHHTRGKIVLRIS